MKMPLFLKSSADGETEKERIYAPLLLTGSGLMVAVCTLVNILSLQSLNVFIATLPISFVIGLYAYSIFSRR